MRKIRALKNTIEDLHNALYKRDLTVSAEEEAPACGIVWMLSHAYFTQLPAIAFHDTSIIRLHESDSCYLMESPKYRCISPKPTAIRGSMIWSLLSKR